MIALDSNLFIYALDSNLAFGAQAQEIFLAVEQSRLDAQASALVIMEVLAYDKITAAQAVKLRQNLDTLGVPFKPVSEAILVEAARLRREQGLGAFDAVHVASAIGSGCDQFVTNDHRLASRIVPGIQIITLDKVAGLMR